MHTDAPTIPYDADEAEPPPRIDLTTLDPADELGTVRYSIGEHTEYLVPEAYDAMRAGVLAVTVPAPPGVRLPRVSKAEPGRFRFRIYRRGGPCWYTHPTGREWWVGLGDWYATAYVPGRGHRGTLNVCLGRWRPPFVRSRAANAKEHPPPLSPEGIARALDRLLEKATGE